MAKAGSTALEPETERPIPESGYLYKYRSLKEGTDRDNTLAILSGNQMWWGRGSSFNDPFDCSHHIRYEHTDAEWEALFGDAFGKGLRALGNWVEAGKARLLGKEPPAPGTEPVQVSLSMTAEDREGKPVSLSEVLNRSRARDLKKTLVSIDEAIGVLCLSQEPDNILLWSHYANSHDGICLRFDVAGHRAAFTRLHPVTYQDDILKLEAPIQDLLGLFKGRPRLLIDIAAIMRGDHTEEEHPARQIASWFYTKSTDWAYEREWRAITSPPGLVRFPARALTGVIVGCVNTEANLALVREAVQRKKPRPKLYVAVKKRDAFGLDIVPADQPRTSNMEQLLT